MLKRGGEGRKKGRKKLDIVCTMHKYSDPPFQHPRYMHTEKFHCEYA